MIILILVIPILNPSQIPYPQISKYFPKTITANKNCKTMMNIYLNNSNNSNFNKTNNFS